MFTKENAKLLIIVIAGVLLASYAARGLNRLVGFFRASAPAPAAAA